MLANTAASLPLQRVGTPEDAGKVILSSMMAMDANKAGSFDCRMSPAIISLGHNKSPMMMTFSDIAIILCVCRVLMMHYVGSILSHEQ